MSTNEPQNPESAERTPRIRLIIDTTEERRQAVRTRARKMSAEQDRDLSTSDVLNELIDVHLLGRSPLPVAKSPRGRKPKGPGGKGA